MAKGITSKGRPTLGRGPVSRGGASTKATTATPGRHRNAPARVSKGAKPGEKRLGGGPITRGGSK